MQAVWSFTLSGAASNTELRSSLYVGEVRHRRFTPRRHAFVFPLFMVMLDLAEVDRVFKGRWLWSTSRPALARFRRRDYLGPVDVPLDQAVRDRVEAATGRRPAGPIRLLTHLRYFGYVFNPVSFYYCYDALGERVETIIAEITNTPWKERHAYVLTGRGEAQVGSREAVSHHRFRFAKAFHVSPFMPMELDYDWTFTEPSEDLTVHMNLHSRPTACGNSGGTHGARATDTSAGGNPKVFDATLVMKRRAISGVELARVLVLFPLMTVQVIAAIHWHAVVLWLKRVGIVPHPKTAAGRSV